MSRSLHLAVLAFGVLLAGPAAANDKISFQFSWIPGGDRAAYYLAAKAGLYAAEGLDVELHSGKGSTDTMTKLATGTADLGEGGLDALYTAKAQTEVPVTAVMAVYTNPPDALITTVESGITSLKDITGKKVATAPFTSSNGAWPFLLQLNGIDPDKVTLIKADAAALSPMLATGRADAIIQFVTSAAASDEILREAHKTMKTIPWTNYGLAGYSASILASDKFLAAHREAVVKFTRALKKAEEMMRDNPQQAAEAVTSTLPEMDLPVTLALVQSTLPLIFNDNTTRDGLGVFSPELAKTTWDWVVKQQPSAPAGFDWKKAVDFRIAQGE